MSDEQNLTGSGSGEQSQAEITHSPSESQAADPKPSNPLLTVENVQKLQEEYPVGKSAFARQSVEAYVKQSNLFLNESETNTEGAKEMKLLDEKDKISVIPHREGICQDPTEAMEESSKGDFQTSSLPSSVLDAQSSKKRDVADLETQTEWSYSDISEDSGGQNYPSSSLHKAPSKFKALYIVPSSLQSEKQKTAEEEERKGGRKKLDKRSMSGKEKRVSIESEQTTICSIGEERDETVFGNKVGSSPDEEADAMTLFQREDHSITDLCHLGCCEFCTKFLQSLPTAEELDDKPDTMEDFLCCRTYKEVFQCVVQELLETNSAESEIDISPHPRLSQTLMESKARQFLKDEIQERGFENYREIFEQYMKFGTCIKIKFKLSDHPPKPRKVAMKKQRPHPKELLEIDTEFQAEQFKICHPALPVTRYYADGKVFFFLFPDGTGQVYYPSGNIAILITYEKDVQFTYMVLRDSSSHAIQAFFTNQGYAACYHQNGTLWVSLDLCTGSFFNQKGIRKKHWNWWDTSSHVHAPPFQPICLQLNVNIQVKIEAQDQIFLIFMNLHHCLQLNVGARLKLKDPKMLHYLKEPEMRDSKILETAARLANTKKLLKKLCAAPPEKINDLYLIIGNLCGQMHRRRNRGTEAKQSESGKHIFQLRKSY